MSCRNKFKKFSTEVSKHYLEVISSPALHMKCFTDFSLVFSGWLLHLNTNVIRLYAPQFSLSGDSLYKYVTAAIT